MKKTLKILSLIAVLAVALTAFAGCDFINGLFGDGKDTTATVTWYNGTVVLKTEEVEIGSTVKNWVPDAPAGYRFFSWYKDAALTKTFNFNDKINEDTSIYASFVSNDFVADNLQYYLVGDGVGDLSVSNWDHNASMNSDALNFKNDNVPGANVFSTTITMYAGDRFQICHDGLWDGQVGIGHMAGAELNEAGDHATVKDEFGIVVFEAPKNEYHADFKQWDITLAEGQDGIYQFTYTTYEDPTQNVLTWKLIEKLDPGSAPVADCDIYFIGTFNEWSTSYEEGSEYHLYDNEDGTWEGTIIIEENMYGDWTLAEVGTLCAALKLYDAANEAWIGYNGDGNLCLTAGVYRIVYTVSTNSFICEILEPGSIVEGGSGSGSTTGPITWYIRGSMNNWGAEADYKLVYDENGNASITLSLMPGDTFKIADATWSEGNQFNASHISGNANFKESIENQNIEVVNGGTYTITVTATGGLTIVADGEEVPPVVEPVEPTEITLYFYTEWTSVNLYTFANNATVGAEWPGAAMTAVEGEDGWYSVTFTASPTGLYVIFNNGTSQTADLAYTGLNYWVGETAYETLEAAKAAIENPPVIEPPVADGITLYYYSATWSNVNLYAWDASSTISASWPGTAMTAVEGENGWFTITLDASAEGLNIIFNDGTNQTADLAYTGLNYWVGETAYETLEAAKEAITAPSDPTDPVAPTTAWYVKGTMNNWSDNADYLLVYDENGNASVTVVFAAGANFKVANSDWSLELHAGDLAANDHVVADETDTNSKKNMKVLTAGTYTVTVTVDGALVVELVEATEPSEPSDPSEPVDPPVADGITLYYYNNSWTKVNLYAWNDAGNFGSWPGTAMTAVEGKSGWFTITLNAPAEGLNIIFNNGSGDQTADLTYAGLNYWVNSTDYETLEEAEAAASAPVAPTTGWYVRGTMNGWGTGAALVYDENGNPSITIDLNAGVTFKVATSDWSQEYKYSSDLGANFKNGAENGNIEVVVAGTYTISIVNGKLVIAQN